MWPPKSILTGLQDENASSILSRFDFVIDCSDNFDTRYLIDECCEALKKAWIYGAIHRYEAQVAIFNLHGSPTYRQLFPKQSIEKIPDCVDRGVLGVLPGLTGMLQATECIKLITGIGEPLVGTTCFQCIDNAVCYISLRCQETQDFRQKRMPRSSAFCQGI